MNVVTQAVEWLNDPLNWTNPGGVLDRLGFPIQATDALIAASALSKGASVLTLDSDFKRVPGLHVISLPPDLAS